MTEFQLKLKTLGPECKVIDIAVISSYIIQDYLLTIKSVCGFNIDDSIKLVHAGKIITDFTQTFEESGINPGDFVVIVRLPPKQCHVTDTMPVTHVPVRVHDEPIAQPAQLQHFPRQDVIQEFWRQVPADIDRQQLYSVEQIHAIVSSLMTTLLQDPQICMILMSNLHTFGRFVCGSGEMRQTIRDFASQSNELITSLQNNNTIVTILQNPSTNNNSLPQATSNNSLPQEPYLTTIIPSTNQISSLTMEDRQNIAELVSMFGMTEQEVTEKYLLCSKNKIVTADRLCSERF